MNGLLFIGYDFDPNRLDVPTITIGRHINGVVEVINTITGDEAVSLYNKLIGEFDVVTMTTAGSMAAHYAFNMIRDMIHKSDITVATYYNVFRYVSNTPDIMNYGWKKGSLVVIDKDPVLNQWKVYFKEKPIKLNGGN